MHTVTAPRHTDLFKSKKLAVLILKVLHVLLYIFNIDMIATFDYLLYGLGVCVKGHQSPVHAPTTQQRGHDFCHHGIAELPLCLTKKWNLLFTKEYHGIDHCFGVEQEHLAGGNVPGGTL